MGCLYSCLYRSRLRAEYDLEEGECPDFLVHCCCEHLALCQEYRELKKRGFDMKLGTVRSPGKIKDAEPVKLTYLFTQFTWSSSTSLHSREISSSH
jgi:hypothetical protein